MYEERTYRDRVRTADLINFEVMVRETDLLVRAKKDLTHETRESVLKYRHQLETYIAARPEFQKVSSRFKRTLAPRSSGR
jgi:ApbE superfamily uncharacterized protein (UPF0280 family)